MKIYTIVAGVNGTGKTSLTGVLKAEKNDLGYIIDADKIATENNNNPFIAGKVAVKKINELLYKKISFTQETTLSGHLTKQTVLQAMENGYYIRLFYIGLNSADESIKRIKNRVEKGGHNIDSETVLYRYNNRFESLLKVLPYCNEVHLFDNENGFVEVAEHKNGELIIKSDYKPTWLNELLQQLNHAEEL